MTPFSKKVPHPKVGKLKGFKVVDGKPIGGHIVGAAPEAQVLIYKNATTLGQMMTPLACSTMKQGFAAIDGSSDGLAQCKSAMEWMVKSGCARARPPQPSRRAPLPTRCRPWRRGLPRRGC